MGEIAGAGTRARNFAYCALNGWNPRTPAEPLDQVTSPNDFLVYFWWLTTCGELAPRPGSEPLNYVWELEFGWGVGNADLGFRV